MVTLMLLVRKLYDGCPQGSWTEARHIIVVRRWPFGCMGNLLDAVMFSQPEIGLARATAHVLLLG